ncbi:MULTISPECIES: GNAT family N-acetyltransferase [Streptomyces]|uniref:GNAT family N-acetyltransferase n=1 Tax=Streptomyces evansiae TaxID=3075535 RepID=A0ABU2R5J1_9ACTN|nr:MULTISPECIES: GNAT family N-acetyltransferase [unclassified Streptomyces]MDT0410960.1 GNAT family N-acetyltransferase [Streptomyces sp. DSM 41979]MYQ56964.1 GNAT family N-acetyltransferase [Streptomyces sp. SID4926]SCE59753.1 Acetyltransferase (GNAT) family protein [Streptomyces sp. DfronAA-171]
MNSPPGLHVEQPHGDDALGDWRHVHNAVIPVQPLSLAEVRERAERNHLDLARAGGVLVGSTTVRPPKDGVATVIARVLPAHRRRGYGTELYAHALHQARALGATAIETCVLASNEDGPRYARVHGFTEIDRYVLPGSTIP